MFQEFYQDTLISRYIKSLLAQTPIPVFESVVDGDYLIEGCYYVYRRYIIRCNSSGILKVSETENLYPSETLYPSVYLYPGYGFKCATFYVKCITDEYNPKTHSTYLSNVNYYDSETHYHLGRLLRYELTRTGLNLFPFYNCYNGKRLSDVELFKSSYNKVNCRRISSQKYKMIAIPINFGRTYTVAVDCPTQVLVRSIIYDDSGYVEEKNLPASLVSTIQDSGKIYSNTQFNNPFKFRVEITDIASYMFQRNLYLVIQLPLSNDSSIVVLENFKQDKSIRCNKDGVRTYDIINPSLLALNTHKSYAFSDRLIEYILGNVIYSGDNITKNITIVQSALSDISYDYKKTFISNTNIYGVWNDDQSKMLMSLIEDYQKYNNVYDQDGNFNKDALSIIALNGGTSL